MTSLPRLMRTLAFLTAVWLAPPAMAQTIVTWTAAIGNFADGGNWDTANVPDTTFDETGNISNSGTALVNTAVFQQPGQIILGQTAGTTGSLTVVNGGNLTVAFTTGNTSSGGINVGHAGTGHLLVQPGGSLQARSITVGGEAASSATFGGVAGGATTITTELGTTFGRNLRIIGPNVNFSTLTLVLQASNTLTAEITAATHSPIKSSNLATLAGTLRLQFGPGVTPAAGSSWNLFDAPAFAGQFTTIDASAAPVLPFGQVYRFNAVPDAGSVNGLYGKLQVEQLLVLNVNRDTGAVSINTGPAPVSIDGYTISSGLGALRPANWTSLQDQGVPNWRESPPGGSVNQLIELKSLDSTAITSAAPRALGNVYQRPLATQFGTELEDVAFEYYSTDGRITQGIVNYLGEKRYNNLVMLIDPATGAGRLENQSNLAVSIDAYKIASASGSLRPANGNWSSLDDQGTAGGDWRESNATVNQLVELKPLDATTLSGGATFNLGSLFQTTAAGGTQDLTFEYTFPGDVAFRQGVVVYKSLAASLTADFNDDMQVNAADLAIWRGAYRISAAGDADSDGDSDGADFLLWQRQLGTSATAAAATAGAAVPEPSGAVMVLAAVCSVVAGRWRGRFLAVGHGDGRLVISMG